MRGIEFKNFIMGIEAEAAAPLKQNTITITCQCLWGFGTRQANMDMDFQVCKCSDPLQYP